MPAGWSIRSTAMMKPTIRFGLPNTHSGNPNGCFGKSNNRFGTPASLFDFNRNARSSSSENPVRHQLKSLFGFAEIRRLECIRMPHCVSTLVRLNRSRVVLVPV